MAEEEAAPAAIPEVELNSRELGAGLFAACKLGRVALAQRLLELGAVVTVEDGKGWAPLHWACFYGHHEVVEVLLRGGAGEAYREEVSPGLGMASPGVGSPCPSPGASPGGGGAAAAASPLLSLTVALSPLHTALSRGHLRCVWALLAGGCSAAAVDSSGNSALHLAASAPIPSPSVRLELLTSVMYAGCDPSARNWQGFTAAQLLPAGEAAAARLLARAAAALHCASTGLPFGGDSLRYLCASTGGFYSEAASSPAVLHAFAPPIPGVTLPTPACPGMPTPLPPPVTDGARLGWVTCCDTPLAVWRGDLGILRPVRLATETCSKVADAEAACLAAANPLVQAVQAARAKAAAAAKAAAEEAEAAAAAAAAEAAAAAAAEAEGKEGEECKEGEGKEVEKEESKEAEKEEAAAQAAAPTAAAVLETPMSPSYSVAAAAAYDTLESPVPRLHLHEDGGGLLDGAVGFSMPQYAQGGGGHAGAHSPTSPALPFDLFLTPQHTAALHSAVAGAREARCDVQVLAAAQAAGARMAACELALAAAAELAQARPLASRAHPALPALAAATATAAQYGAGRAVLGLLALAPALALAELELRNALAVAGRVERASHSSDGVVARLRAAGERGRALGQLLARGLSGEEGDAVSEEEVAAAGSGSGSAASSASSARGAAGGGSSSARMGIPTVAAALPSAPPLPSALCSEADALLQRLQAEVGLSDVVAAGEAAGAAAAAAAVAHAAEDPTVLPVPPLPPQAMEGGGGGAAAAAAAAAPKDAKGGKGGKAAPPAPAKAGGKAPPPPEEPPPHPPVDAAFPVDAGGLPLPHTPQLLALFALREALVELEAAAGRGAEAGADAAAVEAARAAAGRLRGALGEGLMAECLRVEEARKKKKKGKAAAGGGKKK